jgi:hypothetical protein
MMVWAMDQFVQSENNGFGGSSAVAGVVVSDAQQADADQATATQVASATCHTADCGQNCKSALTPSPFFQPVAVLEEHLNTSKCSGEHRSAGDIPKVQVLMILIV